MVVRFVRLCVVICVSLLLLNCGGGGGGGGGGNNNASPIAQTANIVGTVTGSGGLPGVKVSAGGKSTTSDNAGNYKLTGVLVPIGKRLVVTFEKDGYATYQRSVMVQANKTYAVAGNMMQYHLSQSVDPTQVQNLTVSDPGNPGGPSLATLDLPADSVSAVGNVTVNVAVGDPTTGQGRSIFPGDYMASPDAKSEPDTDLESVAFAEITIKDGDKEIKTLTNPADLTIKLPDEFQVGGAKYGTYDPLDSSKNTIEWWSYNEANGSWIREDADPSTTDVIDNAAVVDVGGVLYAKGKVKHFSWWNADHPISEHSCFCVRVVDSDGNPVQGAMVIAEGVTYNGRSTPVMTGADGIACVNVKRSTDTMNPERVKVYVEQGGARFIYDVTDAAEGDVTLNELFTPTTQGSTLDGSGQCSQLTNDIAMVYGGTITGTATREITGSPVEGLTLYTNFGASTVTDASGKYSFKVPVGANVSVFVPGVINKVVNIPGTTPVTLDFVVPNQPPIFNSITRVPSGVVAATAKVKFTADAIDPDSSIPVNLTWSASTGSFDTTSGNAVIWTAPATASTAIITVTATDADGGVTEQKITIIVNDVVTTSTSLKLTVKDDRVSNLPVSGVVVVLYNTDNYTIANTITTGADGIADFGDIGRNTGTLAVIYQNTVSGTLESHIDSYVEVPMGNIVYYVSDSATNVDTAACVAGTDPAINFDFTAVPTGTESFWVRPTNNYFTLGITPYSTLVCSDMVQTDGKVSLLAEAQAYDPTTTTNLRFSYGFLVDQALVADSTYSIALDHSFLPYAYTTNPLTPLSIIDITGIRTGTNYSLTQASLNPAETGSMIIPGDFPVDRYEIVAADTAQHFFNKRKSTLAQTETFNIPDTALGSLNYNATGKSLSWSLSGTAPTDYAGVYFNNSVSNVYWGVYMPNGTANWRVMNLPTMPFTVDTNNLANTFCGYSVMAADYNTVNGFAELWNLFRAGVNVDSAVDEIVVTSDYVTISNLCTVTPVPVASVQSVSSSTASQSQLSKDVQSYILNPLKGLRRQ